MPPAYLRLISSLGIGALVSVIGADLGRAETYSFEHVTVIDGRDASPQVDMTVVVAGDRIASVKPSAIAGPTRGIAIDGRGKYLMPGLMDIHIHLRGIAKGVTEPGPQKIDRALAGADLAGFIYLGVTTVVDLGNQPENILYERREERAGRIQSPRIFATGNLVTYPGSKGDAVAIRISDFEKDKPLLDRHIAEQQPDILKLTYDEQGWGTQQPMVPLMPLPLLQDIIQYYNLQGIRTTVHVTNERRAIEAIYAGVDTLAHPVMQGPVSDAFIKLMAAKKIPFATTLTIGDNYSRLVEHPEFLNEAGYRAAFSEAERQKLRTETRDQYQSRPWTSWTKLMGPICQENIRKIVAAGGVAALGTDQSSGPATHREMQLLVKAGLTPRQVIKIATCNGAVFLGQEANLGSVEPTKLADLVLLNSDPTVDIDHTNDIALVMKNGAIIDESTLPLAGGPQKKRYPAAK